jgi:putative DNA primase/helicase
MKREHVGESGEPIVAKSKRTPKKEPRRDKRANGGGVFASHDALPPQLIINESDPTATAKKLAALIAKRTDFLFNNHMPVRVAVEADCMPRAVEVTIDAVRVHAHEICVPTKLRTKNDKTSRIAAPLSKDIASLYLSGLEGRWGLKPFRGITTSPILANDGSIRIASGYDAASGLWCHNIPDLAIPKQPSEADARKALEAIRSTFETFPFADSRRRWDGERGIEIVDRSKPAGLDETSTVTALLTAVCRPSLDFAPGFLCDAPAFSGAGTGKGLLVKAICIIASGIKPTAFTSGHDAAEFDKRLTAALIEARPAIFLDNFNNKELHSAVLASALTEDPAEVRILGQSKNVRLYTKTFVGVTGNAVEIAEDQARRWLKSRIDAHMENPEKRGFAPGFLEQIYATRPKLLSWALTIWRWGRHNKLKTGEPVGNYETWSRWCRDPLLAIGMPDPAKRIDEIKAADPRRRELVTVFDTWWAFHQDMIMKTADIATEVIEQIDSKSIRRSDGSLQFNRQRVAAFLAAHAGTRVGGYAFNKLDDSGGAPSRPVALYKLQREKKETPDDTTA